MGIIEIVSSILALLGVWLTMRRNMLCWAVYIVSTILFGIVTFHSKLYADTILQVIYLFASLYGTWAWWKNKNANDLIIRGIGITSLKEWLIGIVFTIGLGAATGLFLHHHSNADIPYIDSSCFALSVLGQILQARKKIENWIIWVIADTAYAAVYFYKELYSFGILFIIMTIMAIAGYFSWKKELSAQ